MWKIVESFPDLKVHFDVNWYGIGQLTRRLWFAK
jgi:hypothetical protein